MKAITLKPEFADAIADGRKTIETRPFPPSGDMRPGGVRGLPGCAIDRWERIAIHAGEPYGLIVATACVVDVALIYGSPVDVAEGTSAIECPMDGWTDYSTRRSDGWTESRSLTAEVDLGDYTPGRWGWVLYDVRPLETPVPCKGKQGVWMLPDGVAVQIGGMSDG